MGDMPSRATCSRCGKTFEVRSQMTLTDGRPSIPVLVVPSEVDSVEAALALVVCQVCLEHQGPPERGLHAVLKSLGVRDAPVRPIAVVMAGSARRPSIVPRVVIAPLRPGAASLTSVTIVTTPRTRSRAEGHRDRSDDRPHVRLPPSAPLRGEIGKSGGNAAVLEGVRARLQQQEAARRAREREERQRRFDHTVRVLRLLLLRTRRRAPCQDIDERIVTFDRKLRLAAANDPQQRDKLALMELVGTSVKEFVELSRLVYLTMSVEPYGSNDFGGFSFTRFVPRTPGPRLLKKRRAERAMMDAFPGGRRPESWVRGGGSHPGFYQFEYTGPLRELPIITNQPLPGGGGDPSPCPRITYPEGGSFGSDFEVEHSRCLVDVEGDIDRVCESLPSEFLRWLAQYHEELFITEEMTRLHDDLVDLMEAFFAFRKRERDVQASAHTADSIIESTDTTVSQPDLPAAT